VQLTGDKSANTSCQYVWKKMYMNLPTTVTITASDDLSSEEVQNNDRHYLESEVDAGNGDINLIFSSRLAMYEFAKSLLQEAVFGQGGLQEFQPLIVEGRALVTNGVRLTEESSRIFVFYPNE
jgi:hypothetical protein